MGRIKLIMVKRAARQLLEGEHKFTTSFETDKKILGNTMPSKSIRNKIAGYIARLTKAKRLEKERPKVIKPIEEEQVQ